MVLANSSAWPSSVRAVSSLVLGVTQKFAPYLMSLKYSLRWFGDRLFEQGKRKESHNGGQEQRLLLFKGALNVRYGRTKFDYQAA